MTLDLAIERGVAALRAAVAPDGHVAEANDLGPRFTAQWLALEAFLGGLSPADREAGVAALRAVQNADGSWPPYTGASGGEVSATACCRVALRHCGVPDDDEALTRADRWLAGRGGLAAADPECRPLLAFTGDISPEAVRGPPAALLLVPGVETAMSKLVVAEALVLMFATGGLVVGLQAGRQRPGLDAPVSAAVAQRVLDFLDATRNPRGGTWLGVFPSTAAALVALLALGVPVDDPRVVEARAALASRVHRAGRFFVAPISSEIWATCTGIQAMLAAGARRDDPAVVGGVAFLLAQQVNQPVPRIFTTPPSEPPPVGGWPFEADNTYGPDCDCTAMVLRTLLLAATPGRDDVRAALERGLDWLLSMQNPDGGWPAFNWGHASKPPGVMMTTPMVEPTDLWSAIHTLTHSAEGLGDPSTEALTGRVLTALGHLGLDGSHPAVQRAVVFLRHQQAAPGRWWGRWDCNFTATTAAVIEGLAAVGQGGQLLHDALAWLYARQNADGGWGELPESYTDPSTFGVGPSTPTQTALLVHALVSAGHGDDPQVARAAAWLVSVATDTGWVDPYPTLTVLPPDQLYLEPLAPTALSVIALAAFRGPRPEPPRLGELGTPAVATWAGAAAGALAGLAESLGAALTREAALPGDWTMEQRWSQLVYASYPVDPEAIRPRLPPGVELDTFGGRAWLSLVPMEVVSQRGRGLPTLPGTGHMQELNVRTYVRRGPVRGVWFLSVNVDAAWMVALGRASGVNYQRVTVTRADANRFRAERDDGSALELAVGPREQARYATPGTVEAFLTRRLAAFTTLGGVLHYAALSHPPEWVRPCTVAVGARSLAAADGVPPPPDEIAALAVGDLQVAGWAPVPVNWAG